MPKIHELIPVEADKTNAAKALVDEAIATFSKRADHFTGHVRVVQMYSDERQQENTTDVKEIVESVPSKLDHVWRALIDAIDVTLTKENSNTSPDARADVVVNGVVVLANVPATALLALEKKLSQLQNLYQTIPTLNPAIAWAKDETAALPGVFKAVHPQESQKTEKVMKVLTLSPATDKFPANVEKYSMDENVAKVSVVHSSGMVSPATKALWLSRIAALSTAVKEARQRANMADTIPLDLADLIRHFIHA